MRTTLILRYCWKDQHWRGGNIYPGIPFMKAWLYVNSPRTSSSSSSSSSSSLSSSLSPHLPHRSPNLMYNINFWSCAFLCFYTLEFNPYYPNIFFVFGAFLHLFYHWYILRLLNKKGNFDVCLCASCNMYVLNRIYTCLIFLVEGWGWGMVIDIFEGGGNAKEMVSRILISRGWHIRSISNNITTVVRK